MDKKRMLMIIALVIIGLVLIFVVGRVIYNMMKPQATLEDLLGDEDLEDIYVEPIDPKEAKIIKFESSVLEDKVAEALGKSVPLSQMDLEELVELEAWSSNIRYLDGLEYAVNLEYLDLYNNSIKDITQIAKLTSLKHLNLSHNNIKYASVIGDLVDLETIDMSNNVITEISPLGALKNLTEIDVSYNQVRKCENLSNLPKVQVMKLQGNSIENFRSLAELKTLKSLWVFDNKIKDENMDQFEIFTGIDDFIYK